MNRANVRPYRVRHRDGTLEVDVLRGVGYQAVCTCSWRGPRRPEYHLATLDARRHTAGHRSR